MTVRVSVKYRLGHTYDEDWDRIDMYCPRCGIKTVWSENSAGDYYAGPERLCTTCGASFTGGDADTSETEEDKQRLTALRTKGSAQPADPKIEEIL